MAENPKLSRQKSRVELGVAGDYIKTGFEFDEFLPQLRGERAIRKYREMKDNDSVIGAILMAMDMLLRAVEWRVESADDSTAAEEGKEFVEDVMQDMDHTWEDFVSEVLTFLPFGFSFFEQVYKNRDDGRLGIHKLAPRAQWTLLEFKIGDHGEVEAFVQQTDGGHSAHIPIEKGLLFRTSTVNNSPVGRSVLRNCYVSYHYLTNLQEIEAIAIERELNGLPVGRIPSEYLASDADGDKTAFTNKFKQMLRDVKFNEQGYMLLPSDLYEDADGNPTNQRLVDIELIASNGTRAIDTDKVITRYQQDIARTVLADFLMLGQSEKGSFALSKSKADLFLKAMEGYLNNIAAVLNRHLLHTLWRLNGFNPDTMPKLHPGDVAPVDLEELGSYIRNLSGTGVMFTDEETENTLREAANLPDAPDDPDLMGRNDDQ